MAQHDFGTIVATTKSGTVLAGDLNNFRDAIQSANKGSTAPGYAATAMSWIDDSSSPWVLKIYDGTDWIVVGAIDPTGNTFTSATPAATDSVDGLMSAADKTKLDAIEAGATANFPTGEVALTDGATPALNAALGDTFDLVAAGNRTIQPPSNPVDGQKIIIRHKASGADRTLALSSSTGGFRFGADITGLTATTSAKTDYIGCIYNAAATVWDVVAVTKGF